MAYKVFISYSHRDTGLAHKLARKLSAVGADVFFDTPIVHTGEPVRTRIDAALRASDEVIALVSKDSLESQWQSFEIGAALGLGVKVTPILVQLGLGDLPPVLRSIRSVDSRHIDEYVMKLAERVRSR